MTALVFAAGLLITVTGSASAAPTPTLSQVQAKLTKLQAQVDKLDQQYDQVQQQLAATNQRLGLINQQMGAYSQQYDTMREQIGRIAVAAYEGGTMNSSMVLLTSSDPQQLLNQSSILQELSASNDARIGQFVTAAKQLQSTQELAQRTRTGILQLKASLQGQKKSMDKLVAQQQALVRQLTPAEQAVASPGGGSSGHVTYKGPTATQAQKAVAFAYAQTGCPYVYGGTGPCSAGFDCSGLTSQAWAAAGISIPRTSEEQWAELPHVSTSSLQPGDILVFNGAGHVGIYVGNNELIDAPHTGEDVQLVSFSGWYKSTLDGAVRP